MPQYKSCPYCGAHLDYGEHCCCDNRDAPELETAQRPRKKHPPRREDNGVDEYIARLWREYDMR